ncbi:MAG TPA: LL-diaminopimelate aminotransferase [Firmicutes bacterium]|nr:LL-diaminopimelate aminotransferase [Bacillota bacterium]
MEKAKRLQNLAPYLFARLEQKIRLAKEAGRDVISLGIGDPDLPTPLRIVKTMGEAIYRTEFHQYPTSAGCPEFRRAVSDWYKKRYQVELDPEKEVVALIGSKEGIAHIAFCYINPGDIALVPDPGYPVYQSGVVLAGGEPYFVPIEAKNGFLIDLAAIPTEVAEKAKILYINYPNNPTGAVADKRFFTEVVEFARQFDILVCHDAAYIEVGYDDYQPLSFLQVPGAKDIGIEFGSVSKSHNMTGWRIGWAVGNKDAITTLTTLKTNIDSGVFTPIQLAAVEALQMPETEITERNEIYKKRRDLVISTLHRLGWSVEAPKASIYIWCPVPEGEDSLSFAEKVFAKTDVVITPGVGYGQNGEGYFRISLTIDDASLTKAMERWVKAGIHY